MPWTTEMDDEWDDEPVQAKPIANTAKYNKPSKAADDDWNGGGSSKKNDGWDIIPAKKVENGWNDNAKTDDAWGNDNSNSGGWGGGNDSTKNGYGDRKPYQNDRPPRRNNWICNACSATVFGSRDTCFKCNEPKGDSKDAPPDSGSGNSRPRANDWICSACDAKVFGSRTSCFKCNADKGDSKDAPADSGDSRPPRRNNWICNACSATVFGSKDTCFKCNEPKGDSKDAPPDSGSGNSRPPRASDWICDGCDAKVFGSRSTCFKCNADNGDSKDAPADSGDSRPPRRNNWICNACSATVFGSKDTCFKCNADKGDSKDAPADGADDKRSNDKKPGDWECQCGNKNFAFRTECQKCSEPKPESANDEGFQAEKPKEFYIPEELDENELFSTGISSGINFEKYNDIPVQVTGTNKPEPCKDFETSGLEKYLLDNIKKCNYTKPTPIQKNAISIVLAGRDLMACAQTGSGKTAAFLLPILHKLLTENRDMRIGSPHVVIVSPTRELVSQIFNEARKFAQGSFLKCCQLYGGTATRHQHSKFTEGCHILVATPGRLQDFCDKGYVQFDSVRFVVLDEADRMLDMGFLPAVEKIMSNPTMVGSDKRQTLMFSATFPEDIQRLAGKFLNNYLFLAVGIVGGACTDVEQNFYAVTRFEKRNKLMEILDSEDPKGTMVFVETRRTADFLASFLSESKHPTTSIHGERMQRQREEALRDFKVNKMKVLIATSVAARGLDIPNVRHVINYDLPKGIDDYVHRIGRTGRVGNKGKATSFYEAEQDADMAEPLVKILQQAKQNVPEFLSSAGGSGGSSSAAHSSSFGGRDVRRNDKKADAPAAHGGGDEDEEW